MSKGQRFSGEFKHPIVEDMGEIILDMQKQQRNLIYYLHKTHLTK